MEEWKENKKKTTFFNTVYEEKKEKYNYGRELINECLKSIVKKELKNNDLIKVKKEWEIIIDEIDIAPNLKNIFKSANPVLLKKVNENSKVLNTLYLKVKNTNYKSKMIANSAVIEQIRKDINTRNNKVIVEKIEIKL